MTSLFLSFICILTLFVVLAIGFKPKRDHIVLYTLCISILLTTLFFGLKPKGYRFINQVQWLKKSNGIAFTNIGMIYSEKTFGAIGITDSIIVTAEVLPYSNKRFGRFITILNKNGDEIFLINQWRKCLFVSLQREGNKPPTIAFLPDALSADTIRSVTIGIGSESVWLESDDGKKVVKRLHSGLPSCFIENCTLLIGYGASGKNPWNGELYRLTLSNGCFRHADDSGHLTASGKTEVLKHVLNEPTAEFLFAKSSDRRIINQRCDSWNMAMPLFPKIFKYHWPQPLTSIFPLSKYLSRRTLIDSIVNLFGFIPLGVVFLLLFSTFHQPRSITFLCTFSVTVVTSTSIELIQVFIPTRCSQMIDIILNVTGACIGAFSVLFLQRLILLKNHQKRS